MIYVLIRILAYISVPMIIGFARQGSLTGKQCTLIAIGWALFVAFVDSLLSNNFYQMFGAITGAILGDIAVFLASKAKKQEETEVNDIQVETSNKEAIAKSIYEIDELKEGNEKIQLEEEVFDIVEKEESEKHATEESATNDDIVEDIWDSEGIEKKEEQPDTYDEIPEEALRSLKALFDAGVLTEQEFTEKKRKLLKI